MDLKNAVAVCLISLFSATLVVMIARALDSQAASRLEPQLVSIVEELQAIRKQGGISATTVRGSSDEVADDRLIVYYFHSNTRCTNCRTVESQTRETLAADFDVPLQRGAIVWKILNYEQSAGSALVKKFDIQSPVVVLAKMKGGQIQDWKRLDPVLGLANDTQVLATYLRNEIQVMLGVAGDDGLPTLSAGRTKAATPTIVPADLPLPPATPSLPIPK